MDSGGSNSGPGAPPPPGGSWLPTTGSAAELRQVVAERLQGAGDATHESVLTACVELVANALDHAGGVTGFRIHHDRDTHTVRVEVDDRSAELPRPVIGRLDRLRGRGLAMISSVGRWGADRSGRGKTVWASIGCSCSRPTCPSAA
ncbi:ATP-binding protein [Actinokineospora bangkokensis]|uniref:Histidine kinase/HSP90-like ATPase domain-containing protein n=1 Tax=Actinokineospora bangkokensis TaxID=1193682 RepID=A0A1Q9LLZ6_9PSEU|nr:ATP-binding protein [Actinokineospora bangkokensis]OLR93041.1 hypothetical protein BJP25_19000 [Actinokineospora bangkokensis]